MKAHHPLRIADLNCRIGDRHLFDQVSLTIRSGESVAILGPSGSGKSTLLSLVLGLIKPQSGLIEVDGNDITSMGARDLARARAESIGMVFQFAELLPELSPNENVALAALLAGKSEPGLDSRVSQLLDDFGVPQASTVSTLSGGERQRTAVARALINRPRLLLADEPTGALDEENRDLVADTVFALPKQFDCGLLVVTHDRSVADRADRTCTVRGRNLLPWNASGGSR
jgi:lipoprotein-releasing system ATP-binding protein